MNTNEKQLPLPDLQILKNLARLFDKDGYAQLQFVPFRNNGEIQQKNELPDLLEQEKRLLNHINRKEPILYEHSFCKGYYQNYFNIGKKLSLLADLFLNSSPLPISMIKEDLKYYYEIIEPYCQKIDADTIRFPFRIIQVFELIIVADALDSPLSDRVFFFRDSCLLSSFLRERQKFTGIVADIGTGSGILGLTAAVLGAEKVIALDINPRAVGFAKLNAELNGLADRVEVKLGSIEEALAYKLSWLISNPPYMYCDETTNTFCINGGDDLGMGIPIHFINQAVNHKVPTTMILATPISSQGKNEFEKLLPQKAATNHKRVISTEKLYKQIASHVPLLQKDVAARELAIYEFLER